RYAAASIKSRFLLQAEDGIRYCHVTGVQTCALPISAQVRSMAALTSATLMSGASPTMDPSAGLMTLIMMFAVPVDCHVGSSEMRSEERRVGDGRTARVAP